MTTVGSSGWGAAGGLASSGSDGGALGMGSSGGGWLVRWRGGLEGWDGVPSCSIILRRCSERSAWDFRWEELASAAAGSRKSASCSSSEASSIGSAWVSFV